MTDKTRKPLAIAIGTAFAATLAASTVANAATTEGNPFTMTEMSSGYMHVADAKDGKCGANKTMPDGKCGGEKAKAMKDGKCGEAKCGANKAKTTQGGKAKTPEEGKCGAGKAKPEGK
jgi:uncharacterized low-complexity protein